MIFISLNSRLEKKVEKITDILPVDLSAFLLQ
jgi:hypothetical protein